MLKKFKVKKSSRVRCKKTSFVHFKCKYRTIYCVKVFETSSTHSYTNLVQDPIVRYAKKLKFINLQKFRKRNFFALCNKNSNCEWFFDGERPRYFWGLTPKALNNIF